MADIPPPDPGNDTAHAADPSALRPGYALNEYRIEKVIGHGGFAMTYLARDTHLQSRVAIKEYLPTDLAFRGPDLRLELREPDFREPYEWGRAQFIREAQILARFRHPNIVSVNRFFEAHDVAYIVMEYVEGRPLASLLRDGARLRPEHLLSILRPALDGLRVVHEKGILHRDIKPENVLLRPDGSPVLIDFGAASKNVGNASHGGVSLFTPGYTPMEQYSDSTPLGPWTDLYSLAAIACTAITGAPPPDSISRLNGDSLQPLAQQADLAYPAALLRAVDWALSPFPADRPQSVDEFLAALDGNKQPMQDTGSSMPVDPLREDPSTGATRTSSAPCIASIDHGVEKSARTRVPRWLVAAITLGAIGIAMWIWQGLEQSLEAIKRPGSPEAFVSTSDPALQPQSADGNREVTRLTERGRSDRIDPTTVALSALKTARDCEAQLPWVKTLRQLGDRRALPVLREALGSGIRVGFGQSCLRAEARAAIAEIEARYPETAATR